MLAGKADAAAEAAVPRQVEDLQQRAGKQFVVLYSRYWRCYIAYYWGNREADRLILRAPSPNQLWDLIDRVAPTGTDMAGLPHVSTRPAVTFGKSSDAVSAYVTLLSTCVSEGVDRR